MGNHQLDSSKVISTSCRLDAERPITFLKTPCCALLSLELVLLDREGSLEQLLLLSGVGSLQTGSDGCTWVASSVHDVLSVVVLGLVEQGLNSRLGERPGTGVERFLLAPDDGLGVRVLVEVLLELLPWEGVELLDTGDSGILDTSIGAVLVESSVDLTCAENDALNVFWRLNALAMLWIFDDPLEL
jgi:hypothetical protein